jgi:glycosyltransferase involved in cell wall biosynthesis
MPDISVVIPAYNAESTIDICFSSVYEDLKDSGYTFEIIIINDGSLDNTMKCLEKIKDEHTQYVHIIDQKNAGPSSARNAGLKAARGKYIAFCDSDDMWERGKTSLTMKVFKEHPNIKCFGGKYIGKEQKAEFLKKNEINNIKLKNISLTMNLFFNRFSPPTAVISRNIIEAGIFFNERMKYSEDREYFNRILHKFSAAIVKDVLAKSITEKYAYGESGLSGNLWKMEKGDLYSIYLAYKILHVNLFICVPAILFSLAKHFRRLVIVAFRKTKHR